MLEHQGGGSSEARGGGSGGGAQKNSLSINVRRESRVQQREGAECSKVQQRAPSEAKRNCSLPWEQR